MKIREQPHLYYFYVSLNLRRVACEEPSSHKTSNNPVKYVTRVFFHNLPTRKNRADTHNKSMGKLGRKYILVVVAVLVVAAAFCMLGIDAKTVAGAQPIEYSEPIVNVSLAFGDYTAVYRDEPLSAADFTVTEEMHERRINAPYEEKLECVEECLALGASPKAAILYCFPRLKHTVETAIKNIERDPKNAETEFRPYSKPMFYITRETVGYSVNEQRLYYDIYLALRKSAEVKVAVAAEEIAPEITADELKEYTVLRSRFATDYSSSGENRKHNIRLALGKINGKRVDDGVEFSFNKTVGRRTAANGFQDAKIIVDGEYVEGTGGGVCQASTTVYNCALLSDMRIVEARNHSLPPSYVPPSFDAMVNSGGSDMRFINETGGPIFIRAYGTDDQAIVEIYGKKPQYKIVRDSVVTSKSAVPIDKTIVDEKGKYVTEDMLSGESKRVRYGVAGLTSEGYLLYYEDGKLADRKLIRKDVYRSVQGVIAVKP